MPIHAGLSCTGLLIGLLQNLFLIKQGSLQYTPIAQFYNFMKNCSCCNRVVDYYYSYLHSKWHFDKIFEPIVEL